MGSWRPTERPLMAPAPLPYVAAFGWQGRAFL